MLAAMSRPDFYEELLAVCPPFTLPGLWNCHPVDPDIRACPAADTLMGLLRSLFAPAELLRSALVGASENGALRPTDALVEGAPLIILRTGPEAAITNVLTTRGMLLGDDLPVIACLRDHATREALQAGEGILLAACSLLDVAVLRSLRLP